MRELSVKWKEIESLEPWLFYSLLFVFLIPVLSNQYFLTGDGPCHVYNSKVLLDITLNKSVDFYKEFYFINPNTDPNWLSHLILAFLQMFLPGWLSDKIFVIGYIVAFCFSFRALLQVVAPPSSFLAILIIPFAVHHTFQMGFYNYSLSFVFCFLLIRHWLVRHRWGKVNFGVVFFMLSLLLYFSHPIGYLFAGLIIGALVLFNFLTDASNLKNFGKCLFQPWLWLFIGFGPTLILFLNYISRKGLGVVPSTDSFNYLQQRFFELTSLVALSDTENMWTTCISVLVWALFGFGLVNKLKNRVLRENDAFLFVGLAAVGLYFFQPAGIAGAGVLSVRMQFIPYLFIILWMSTGTFSNRIKWIVLTMGFIFGTCLVVVRFPVYSLASDAVEECMSAEPYLESESVILPLSFSHNGCTESDGLIANRIWLFMHAMDYLGTAKPLVLLGNYEGNTGYFPLVWEANVNPFKHLSQESGIEAQPPCLDISNYEDFIERKIDYVITWCEASPLQRDDCNYDAGGQIGDLFNLIHESEGGRVRVYKRKNTSAE